MTSHRFAAHALLLAAAVAAPSILAACATETRSDAATGDDALTDSAVVSRPVQMNDVSVLLPLLGATQDEIDANYLSASTLAGAGAGAGAGGAGGAAGTPLLARDVFDLANSGTGGINFMPTYESMRLVAFRFDPCFANIGPITNPATCKNQLRLIFQAVRANDSTHAAQADDGAFHAFYSLTRADLVRALDEMTALRLANDSTPDLGPLAVHPIVKQQGMSGPMAKGLEAIVMKYAQPKNLVRVTSFHGIFAQGTSWSFDVVDVKNGTPSLSKVATLTPAGTIESTRLGTAATGLLQLSIPSSSSPDGNHLLLDPVKLQTATAADRQAAYDSALRVENPGFHSPNTIDCVTCHSAQISRQLIGEQFFHIAPAGNPNLFVAAPSIPAADLALTVPVKQPNGLSLNLHAFSYDGADPTIITRVVNETASVVAYVDSALMKAPH